MLRPSLPSAGRTVRRGRQVRLLGLAFLAVAGCARQAQVPASRYVFHLNGVRESLGVLSMNQTPDDPREGDLVFVGGVGITLGPPGEYRFRTSPEREGLVFLVEGETERPVGAEAGWAEDDPPDGREELVNPLAGLTGEEMRGLRGLRITFWNDAILEKLRQIDPTRCYLSISYYPIANDWPKALWDEKRVLPRLPKGFRHLFLSSGKHWYETPSAVAALAGQDSLRSFSFLSNVSPSRFDLALIKDSKQLRHLDLKGQTLENPEHLSGFAELRYLNLGNSYGLEDFSFLRQMQEVRKLVISMTDIDSSVPLAECTKLRYLDLSYCDELNEIAALAGMRKLERLDIQGTGVTDLTPLSGLELLSHVDAHGCPVAKLPEGRLPALRTLNLLGDRVFRTVEVTEEHEDSLWVSDESRQVYVCASVSDEEIARFRDRNPDCHVIVGWTDVLHEEIGKTTRIRIRTGGACSHDTDKQLAREKTLFEVVDPERVREIIAHFRIDEEKSGFGCGCCGWPTFEFYRGDELLAALSFHHGKSVRWRKGCWPGDGMLLPGDAAFLVNWLAENGVRGPLGEVEGAKAEALAEERKLRRATEGMSDALVEAFKSCRDWQFHKALEKEYPDPEKRALVLLRIYGVTNGSWRVHDWIDRMASEPLKEYESDVLAKAVREALLGDNRRARQGAARFWEMGRNPLDDWEPEDAAKLHGVVLTVLQESRYYPLRQWGLRNLYAWSDELSPDELDRRLSVGFCDPHPSVRRQAMITAGKLRYRQAIPHLMRVLSGREPDVSPLPDIPPDEREDIDEGIDDIAGKRPEPEVAALALGYAGHAEAAQPIRQKEPWSPMYEVALALLGETERLKAEHFRGQERNKELQLAAVEAVIRCKGRHGLRYAIDYDQATHWWEEGHVAKRLKKMLLAENAPERDLVKKAETLRDLAEWYEKHGDEYVESLGQP